MYSVPRITQEEFSYYRFCSWAFCGVRLYLIQLIRAVAPLNVIYSICTGYNCSTFSLRSLSEACDLLLPHRPTLQRFLFFGNKPCGYSYYMRLDLVSSHLYIVHSPSFSLALMIFNTSTAIVSVDMLLQRI